MSLVYPARIDSDSQRPFSSKASLLLLCVGQGYALVVTEDGPTTPSSRLASNKNVSLISHSQFWWGTLVHSLT